MKGYVPSVSVVVLTFEEFSLIEKKLNNIWNQRYDCDKLEDLAVDCDKFTSFRLVDKLLDKGYQTPISRCCISIHRHDNLFGPGVLEA